MFNIIYQFFSYLPIDSIQCQPKPQKTFCLEIEKLIISSMWKCKKPNIGKTILKKNTNKKKEQNWKRLTVSRFTLKLH